MKPYVMRLTMALQALFTTTAIDLGRRTGFIKRQRLLTADGFAQTLVFRWLAKPDTTLETLARELQISPQALDQRLGQEAQDFLRALLVEALKQALKTQPQQLGLLDRFGAVVVEDTTVMALPATLADAFPGCGGGSGAGEGAAALKVLLRWDIRSGAVLALSIHAGRTSDQTLAANAADLPADSLHLADMGFFDSERWQDYGPGQFWISRVPARTQVCWQGVWQPLETLLASRTQDGFDDAVQLVAKTGLPCRLVARRCPAEVANRRRQKLREHTQRKKGRAPSAAQLLLCDWLVFASNTTATQLGPREVWVVYRCRWQVELLFKRAKSLTGWGSSRGQRGARVLVELYAKILGLVVAHWGTLLAGGPLNGISLWKRWCEVQEMARSVQASLRQGTPAIGAVLTTLAQQLGRIRAEPKKPKKPSKKPSTRQLLLNPGLAA